MLTNPGRIIRAKAVRLAWSHVLFPVKAAAAGTAFDLDHLSISSKDRAAIPTAVYEKAGPRGDGILKEKLGPDALALHLKPLWPEDQPHLRIQEVADWFTCYAYLPKLRDRVVLDEAIREAVGKLDPAFGYADAVDAGGTYSVLRWIQSAPEMLSATAVLVRAAVAAKLAKPPVIDELILPGPAGTPGGGGGGLVSPIGPTGSTVPKRLRRFYGSVQIDPAARPMKAFEAILDAVVMQLQNAPGTRVKLTLEVEAEASEGFSDDDAGVVRDNAKQLKFRAASTGFE